MGQKILHLLKSDRFSGAENMVCQIIEMYKGSNRKMFYCSPNGPIADSLKEKCISFIPMKNISLFSLRNIIKDNDITLIHAHDPGASVLAAFGSFKSKIIAHIHGNHDDMKVCSIKSFLFAISSFRYSKIIWVSESALSEYYFKKFIRKKSVILVNTINSEEILIKANNNEIEYYDCIFLGRLSNEKNPLRALDIISEVIKSIPNYRAVFVGDGNLRQKCEEYVSILNIENNIVFKGFSRNPIPILKNSNVLLMTSIYEGTPMSALEAMCLGKPIVSTPTDGLLKLIKNYETGCFSEDNQILINALIMLEKDKIKYCTYSNNTIQYFSEINNTEDYKNRLDRLYEEI